MKSLRSAAVGNFRNSNDFAAALDDAAAAGVALVSDAVSQPLGYEFIVLWNHSLEVRHKSEQCITSVTWLCI